MAQRAGEVLGAQDLIAYILKEPKILQKVTQGLKPKARGYSHCKIVLEEERIYFGKYSWGGISGFWMELIKCYDHISFADFLVKVWDTLMEMTTNPIAQEAIREGLSREMLIKGIHEKDQNILHRFFDVLRHIVDDGYWRDKGLNSSSTTNDHHFKSCPYAESGIEVEVEARRKNPGFIKVVDSIGDVFEVISVNWLGGRR